MKMWRDYLTGWIRNNRSSSGSIMIAAFISALLLSLLCSLFYNLWFYEVHNLKQTEGDWQVRIVGEIDPEDLNIIESYAGVEKVIVREDLTDHEEVTDVYFKNVRDILTDMPEIARLAGIPEESVSYHYSLLNLYLIRSPEDSALRWIFPFFFLITTAACFSLILVIHNAFAVTMSSRIRQLGIFSSTGATPRQIRAFLLQEALFLCTVPIVVGSLIGILICIGAIEGMNILLADLPGRLSLPFQFSPWVYGLSLAAGFLTVIISAWIPAKKLSRFSPLEAIRSTEELHLKKARRSPVLSRFCGIEGELAGSTLKAQRRSLRTASLSLFLSFLAFSFMMCFLSLQQVNQDMTYFTKYQDAWDVMITLKNTNIEDFSQEEALRELENVESSLVYQKAEALRLITQEEISEEMQTLGAMENAPVESVTAVDNGWLVNAPIVILDDESFLEYSKSIGAEPRLDGTIILNQAQDGSDPNFHNRNRIKYLTGDQSTTILRNSAEEDSAAEIPVLSYTDQVPLLREEYGTVDFYELVHFIPESLWKEIRGEISGEEQDTYIRILARDGNSLTEANQIEKAVSDLLGSGYETVMENRIQEKTDNDNIFNGLKVIIGLFCTLLALIGIGNIFTHTFGFVRQRKREFARYMSIGMTPSELSKVFIIEALAMIGPPILIAVSITAVSVIFFVNIAYIDLLFFLRQAPVIPILFFILTVLGFVALAYYYGARKVLSSSLIESLRDDTIL